ncbi:hypothetical protein ACRE_039270 [Hapsidospora chrysogenum ATCC 11550]|uniref:Btz domain-containing protein n=1 Tax=Hapsidospora chrysogenum (strain ATCC 11550 / CBS 779.69 / DSM 880 / IAM 14645 / JCM 23072 / IMI 49137) TaxID=857340 RepID=A0A086T7B6_HAPC1|nr:hypothetical protein ACRE_039270 [Hapsidospora chrysogenum ATCC 11550]
MAALRRRKLGHRRRVEDEGEDDGGPEALDMDDDSLTDGSLATDDHDADEDSDTSNVDEASPTSPKVNKSTNGTAKVPASERSKPRLEGDGKAVSDTEIMLHGLSITGQPPPAPPEELHFDEVAPAPAKSPSAPIVVSSAAATRKQPESVEGRRRQEHEDYRRRRDEDPAFVPNRGSFFMHDHRHPGPAANGFRPFGRGRGRGGRGGIGGPFSPMKYDSSRHVGVDSMTDSRSQMHRPGDPTTSSPWTHDMHETIAQPGPRRSRQAVEGEGPPNGTGFIPTREPNPTPINRTLSTEKHIGNVQVRILLPGMKTAIVKSGLAVKQYTKLPDHRPPLRRDKPVRISLPNRPPRYIYPAVDRSFIFIPRAMRPNQQRVRGKGRSGMSSVGGISRRTSVFGGSYYGSMYSPSVAMSRRSSLAHERDVMFSPTGSVVSRPAMPVENPRPVVRLPPAGPVAGPNGQLARQGGPEPSFHELSQQQQKPHYQENRSADLPMHQPRPQKNISVADIESPTINQGPQAFQQAFHQQVPVQVANGYPKESHTRQPSYISQHSSGTPLSQIPERAIHAAPFQPNTFGQPPPYYSQQGYPPPPAQQYYYPPGYSAPSMPPQPSGPAFAPPGQQGMPGGFVPQGQGEQGAGQASAPNPGMVAQEANGMVYYYDPSQLPPPTATYPPYSAPQGYQLGVMGMGGMVTPSPDGYFYPQGAPAMVYYPQ